MREVEAEKSFRLAACARPDVQSDKSPFGETPKSEPDWRHTRDACATRPKNLLALVFPGNGMGASQPREGEVNIACDNDRIASWEAVVYNFFTARA